LNVGLNQAKSTAFLVVAGFFGSLIIGGKPRSGDSRLDWTPCGLVADVAGFLWGVGLVFWPISFFEWETPTP